MRMEMSSLTLVSLTLLSKLCRRRWTQKEVLILTVISTCPSVKAVMVVSLATKTSKMLRLMETVLGRISKTQMKGPWKAAGRRRKKRVRAMAYSTTSNLSIPMESKKTTLMSTEKNMALNLHKRLPLANPRKK